VAPRARERSGRSPRAPARSPSVSHTLAQPRALALALVRVSLRALPRPRARTRRAQSSERFLAAKAAYDLLCEGMENGGKGFGGPVFSAGDIEARFASTTGVALARASEAAEAARAGPADGAG
jgi:hypothetical protein